MSGSDESVLSPGQAGFRFLVELTAIVCWGIAGWQVAEGALSWVLAVVVPLIAAIIWGTFRAPDDHSANGRAPVPVPGIVRLLLEIDILLGAAIAVAVIWQPVVGVVFAAAVVLHYLTTVRRVRWLLAQRPTRSAPPPR